MEVDHPRAKDFVNKVLADPESYDEDVVNLARLVRLLAAKMVESAEIMREAKMVVRERIVDLAMGDVKGPTQ